MINTYRYGGQGEIEKDGKKSIVQIPPPVVLNRMGGFYQSYYYSSSDRSRKFKTTREKCSNS